MEMPLYPTWSDIALRLALTMAASAAIGFERGLHGHVAGLRTTILVGLAAAAAMIQANILLPLGGKNPGSFAVMDLMRLPLGILTGVGFIGGGAILRRGGHVAGVTTAATLWTVTVIGLCFGGGQLGLGLAASALALATLRALKWAERWIPREHTATLEIKVDLPPPSEEMAELIGPAGYHAKVRHLRREPSEAVGFEIRWRRSDAAGPAPDLVGLVSQRYAVLSFEASPESED